MTHKINFFALLIFIVTFIAVIPFIANANECDHNIIHVEAQEPSCHSDGNIEYWRCDKCNLYWAFEDLSVRINNPNLSLVWKALGHNYVDGVCDRCGECENHSYTDGICGKCGDCENHNIVYVEAIEATCHSEGNIEYWYCDICEQFWADEGLIWLINYRLTRIESTEDVDLIFVPQKDSNCDEVGMKEHWYCPECGIMRLDPVGIKVPRPMLEIPAVNHIIEYVPAVAPTCETEGNVEYWHCAECDQYWSDEARTQLINRMMTIVPTLDHEIVEVEEIKPTCHYAGNISYKFCTVCYTHWTADGKLTNAKNVITPALGHNYEDGICTNCGEEEPIDFEFEDVKPNQWYTEAIYYCYNNGYMVGISETTFGYKDTVTRAMFVTILAKIDDSDLTEYEGKSSFTDVKTDGWYTAAIEWAYRNGYAAGLGDGIFGYKNDVSREQIAMFFYTYSEKNGVDVSGRADLSGYSDTSEIHDWALEAVAWAVDAGLISGTGENTLSPGASATRSEIAVIVKNYTNKIKP